MAKKICAETEDPKAARAARWAKWNEYLDGVGDHLNANSELKPGTSAFAKLKALSDKLAEVQEQDFQARQLKQEIDRALAAASGDGGGGLVGAFAKLSKASDDDRFE